MDGEADIIFLSILEKRKDWWINLPIEIEHRVRHSILMFLICVKLLPSTFTAPFSTVTISISIKDQQLYFTQSANLIHQELN